MKFLDLFSGIGGFRLGLEAHGHECVGFCEIDKFARESYKAIHNTEGELELHDITAVADEQWGKLKGTVDIIAGGFPCQAFSIAGKRKGFEDETRGTLFFEIMRAAKQIQPSILFLENVKGLLNHDKGRTFRIILQSMDELGYDAEWQVLNSKDFGVPQNRERVFLIGHIRNGSGREVFPIRNSNKPLDIVQRQQIHVNTITTKYGGAGGTGAYILEREQYEVRVKEATSQGYPIAEPGDSINFEQPNSKTRRGRVGKGIANTLTTSCNQATLDYSGIYTNDSKDFSRPPLKGLSRTVKANNHDAGITDGFRIRKLTPKECWRLQGYPDWAFDRAAEVNSNSQLYKQAGNSVTVNVIAAIAERLV